nr:immunoglobulin light chain junction region [Macaca mulatta]MOX77908.1 immunoglobulin light chain junction region [Macaca mulatta]MOX78560.1 immunoglobulin light chain junction region [Macaca mulatta]MOX78880.1 immunoglobulin light chain junction region [Macaca mulatta]MOX79730.1 immunoglobulin light chain junction region [Macaca mulatta]
DYYCQSYDSSLSDHWVF